MHLAIDCPSCGATEGLKLREAGYHTAIYGCSCGNVRVRDRGCYVTCGCAP